MCICVIICFLFLLVPLESYDLWFRFFQSISIIIFIVIRTEELKSIHEDIWKVIIGLNPKFIETEDGQYWNFNVKLGNSVLRHARIPIYLCKFHLLDIGLFTI